MESVLHVIKQGIDPLDILRKLEATTKKEIEESTWLKKRMQKVTKEQEEMLI